MRRRKFLSKAQAAKRQLEWDRSRYQMWHSKGETGRLARAGAKRGLFDVAAVKRYERLLRSRRAARHKKTR